jgi:two-component system chemotaxis response regulator CheB
VTPHDIVVIGASAGGIEALRQLLRGIPPDFPAAVLVVVHLRPRGPSSLPSILSHSGSLPAAFASADEPIEPGRIYVAPPDHHMIVEDWRVQLWRGPKENLHRPAINTLFRSAAVSHRARVVGVILSGFLDDGSAGLWWIKRYGGVTVVQDPSEATFPEMAQNAIEYVEIDHVVRLCQMGKLLSDLAAGNACVAPEASAGAEANTKSIWKPKEQ